jgi:ATP-binding cassette, subfamily B, bacterial
MVRALLPVLMLYIGKLIIDEAVRLVAVGIGDAGLAAPGRGGVLDTLLVLLLLEFGLAIVSDLLGRAGQLRRHTALGAVHQRHQHPPDGARRDPRPRGLRGPRAAGPLDRARRQTMGRMNLMGPALRPGAGRDHGRQLRRRPAGLRAVADPAAGWWRWCPPSSASRTSTRWATRSTSPGRPERRQLEYVRQMGASVETAKEVKIFGLHRFLIARYRELADDFYRANRALAIGAAPCWGTLLATLGTLGYYAAYAYIAWRTVRGDFTIGDLTFLAGSFRRLRKLLEGLLVGFSQVAGQALYLDDLFSFFEIEPEIVSKPDPRPVPRPIRAASCSRTSASATRTPRRWALRGPGLRAARRRGARAGRRERRRQDHAGQAAGAALRPRRGPHPARRPRPARLRPRRPARQRRE